MEYTKQTWIAPEGNGLNRYAKSAESASHVTLTLDPVNLTNSPTPFTMARMAHMEDGIAKAYDTAPPTPWAQYSGKDIPQLPDNVAGTAYKRDNDWVSTDGWVGYASINTLSIENNMLKVVSTVSGAGIERTIELYANKTVVIAIESQDDIGDVKFFNGDVYVTVPFYKITNKKVIAYFYSSTTHTSFLFRVYNTANTPNTIYVSSIYIGSGAYDRLVFDNSYHYRHLLNNAVVPTPHGLYFNGETSYLRSKEKVTLPDVFTFSATVNCAISSNTQAFCCVGQYNTPSVPFIWIIRNANNYNLSIPLSNGTTQITTLIANYFSGYDNIDVDLKVEVDFVSKTVKAYRNGVQFGTTISVPTMVKPAADYMFLGRSVNTEFLLGYMRNIQLFDTALTDTQRNWLAQGNTPPILYDVTNYETEGYVSIQDADGTNTGAETDVDSNGNRILKLPSTIKANLTGNADTATKLATSRKIGSVYFDGSADIEIPIENYSTTEKIIGTWIDGKPLYRKVVSLGYLPNATTKAVPHKISNIGFLKICGYANSLIGNYASLPFVPATELNQAVNFYISGDNILIQSFLDRSSYTGVAVLEYTKTTD